MEAQRTSSGMPRIPSFNDFNSFAAHDTEHEMDRAGSVTSQTTEVDASTPSEPILSTASHVLHTLERALYDHMNHN
jgi:hypothetical protein